MTWNYRVVITQDGEGRQGFGIHEVYYGHDGTPESVSEREVPPWGETLEELKIELKRFQIALEQPPLKMSYFDERERTARGRPNDG